MTLLELRDRLNEILEHAPELGNDPVQVYDLKCRKSRPDVEVFFADYIKGEPCAYIHTVDL